MPASPIRKLVPLADAARARGTKIYHLNIGQPDLPSPKEGLESLKHIDRKVLEYSPSDGYRSLREKLVTYYEQYQIKLSPEEIIVTTGGSEAVLFAFMSCLNPGVYSPIPMGAFYTVARLPVDDSDKFCAWCLSDFEYEGETVMMAPASGFYSDPECGRNEVRIAYVLKKEDLERALLILGKALEAYNARK